MGGSLGEEDLAALFPFREAKVVRPGRLSRARCFLRARNGVGLAARRPEAGEFWGPELTSISLGYSGALGCLEQKG